MSNRCNQCGRFIRDECTKCTVDIGHIATSIVSMGMITTLITGGGISECLDRIRSLCRDVVGCLAHPLPSSEIEQHASRTFDISKEGPRMSDEETTSDTKSTDDLL